MIQLARAGRSRLIARLAAGLALACALWPALSGPARAATEAPPCRIAIIIVGSSVGSATDIVMRAFADRMNARGAKPELRVVNKLGDTVVEQASKAPTDGCTMLAVTQSLVADRLAREHTVDWQVFQPVARLTRTTLVLAGRTDLTQKSLTEVLNAARGAPETITIGIVDTPIERFFMRMLYEAGNVRLKEVSFANARLRYMALLGKRVDLSLVSVASVMKRGSGRNKELEPLAVSSAQHLARLPEVPSFRDQGVQVAFGIERGLVVPKGVNLDRVEYLAAMFEKMTSEPELIDRLGEVGTSLAFLGPDPYTRYFENLTADWRELLQRTGRASPGGTRPRS